MPSVINKGISIHYRVEGDGPPLVLVHGITDGSDVFYEQGYVAALKSTSGVVECAGRRSSCRRGTS